MTEYIGQTIACPHCAGNIVLQASEENEPKWEYLIGKKAFGPCSSSQIRSLLIAGIIQPTTKIRRIGTEALTKIHEKTEFTEDCKRKNSTSWDKLLATMEKTTVLLWAVLLFPFQKTKKLLIRTSAYQSIERAPYQAIQSPTSPAKTSYKRLALKFAFIGLACFGIICALGLCLIFYFGHTSVPIVLERGTISGIRIKNLTIDQLTGALGKPARCESIENADDSKYPWLKNYLSVTYPDLGLDFVFLADRTDACKYIRVHLTQGADDVDHIFSDFTGHIAGGLNSGWKVDRILDAYSLLGAKDTMTPAMHNQLVINAKYEKRVEESQKKMIKEVRNEGFYLEDSKYHAHSLSELEHEISYIQIHTVFTETRVYYDPASKYAQWILIENDGIYSSSSNTKIVPENINDETTPLKNRGLSDIQANIAMGIIKKCGFSVSDALSAWDQAKKDRLIVPDASLDDPTALENFLKSLSAIRDFQQK